MFEIIKNELSFNQQWLVRKWSCYILYAGAQNLLLSDVDIILHQKCLHKRHKYTGIGLCGSKAH